MDFLESQRKVIRSFRSQNWKKKIQKMPPVLREKPQRCNVNLAIIKPGLFHRNFFENLRNFA